MKNTLKVVGYRVRTGGGSGYKRLGCGSRLFGGITMCVLFVL